MDVPSPVPNPLQGADQRTGSFTVADDLNFFAVVSN